MKLSPPPLVVAFELSERRKSIVADGLAGASAIIYLAELDGAARAEALRNAGALLTHNTAKDLRSGEAALLHSAWPIQFTIAGVDFWIEAGLLAHCLARRRSTSSAMSVRNSVARGEYSDGRGILNQ